MPCAYGDISISDLTLPAPRSYCHIWRFLGGSPGSAANAARIPPLCHLTPAPATRSGRHEGGVMRYLQTMVAALAAVLTLAIPASAQQGTAQIQGKISDAQGALLPGVTVTVRNQETGMFRETVSNPDGSYFISGMTPGTYRMTAELQGFRKFERSGILLEVGTHRHDRGPDGSRRPRRERHGDGGDAARRRHVQGGRRQHQRPRAHRSALADAQLHQLHRPDARRRRQRGPDDLRRRQRLGQRPGLAQQQLLARRRQQQRRLRRAARRACRRARRSKRSRNSR